jgi:hypothetical protein
VFVIHSLQRANQMKRNTSAVAVLVTAACMGACNPQPPSEDVTEAGAVAQEGQQDFQTLEDRYSYAYGAHLAEQFRAEGIELNVALMAAAMQAVVDGGEKKMSAGEIAATIQLYQEAHAKKKEAEWALATEKNNKEKGRFF